VSKNLIIAIVAGVLVVGGGAAYFVMRDDSSTETTSASSSVVESQDTDATAFNPVNTTENDFVATFVTQSENGEIIEATARYDAENTTWEYKAIAEGQQVEAIFTPDAIYTNANGQWVKVPSTSGDNIGFNTEDFEINEEDRADFQSNLIYMGEANCPSGTCDHWQAENFQGNDTLSFYLEKQTNRVNQISSVTDGRTITITYSYEDVTIEIPTDFQELPEFNL